MKELWQLTAHEANEGLRSRDFSSVDLTKSVLERLNSVFECPPRLQISH